MEETLMDMMMTTTTTIIKNWRGHVSSNEMLDQCLLFSSRNALKLWTTPTVLPIEFTILLPVC
jgi:hypothetical protein